MPCALRLYPFLLSSAPAPTPTQAAAYTSSPASLLKAPSLAPLLTAADRNESFMSARETLSLATPLGEDLVAAAASASPGMMASRPAHMFRQVGQTSHIHSTALVRPSCAQ